ncbi:unnamed protein product [Caenorhabditis sp. 36 PRJEB53466]|nr:unnamed protein product [Caenorhabditis sp. 36 PRJEB53466]
MSLMPTASTQNTIVSKILQVALGLFVTTSDLPTLPLNHEQLSYDCSFDSNCRWTSVGNQVDRWRIARGEPDSLLWLAATGTMQIPREPYALIESRGDPVDALATDAIRCQKGYAELSFTYWVVGNVDIEICLADLHGEKFNCTGMLKSDVMPGKVLLKIPELQKPFRVMIQPSVSPGVIVLDDLRYDASMCTYSSTVSPSLPADTNQNRGRPDFMTTLPPRKIRPWTSKRANLKKKELMESTTTQKSKVTFPTKTGKPSAISVVTFPESTTEAPFDLLIVGNRTKLMKDKRTGKVIEKSSQLLCDFNNEFSCQWGAEAGRWAIIEKGAIPSLEDSILDPRLLPTYPANNDSNLIHCVEQSTNTRYKRNTLAVFEINRTINEQFTLNIVPQWENGLKNRFLVIDEIAYIGECDREPQSTSAKPSISTKTVSETNRNILPPIEKNENHSTTSATTRSIIPPIRNETTNNQELAGTTETTESPNTTTESAITESIILPADNSTRRKVLTTFAPVYPEEIITRTLWTRRISIKTTSTTLSTKSDDYCDLLNCSFDDTACNYLNHGLTKKPWTLRNRGYGYPLTGTTDIRATQTNGQFVSTILDAGDIAILESPKFDATKSSVLDHNTQIQCELFLHSFNVLRYCAQSLQKTRIVGIRYTFNCRLEQLTSTWLLIAVKNQKIEQQ